MNFYLGVTDNDWYNHLQAINPDDINFWKPGGNVNFKALKPGEPFLFKLKSPANAIGGVGFFTKFSFLPLNMAWDVFRERNGCASYKDFEKKIYAYRASRFITESNPIIGCVVLTNPIFFSEEDWIPLPDWSSNNPQGKGFSMNTPEGLQIWKRVETLINLRIESQQSKANQFTLNEEPARYGFGLSKIRIGQGAFRVLVTDAYNRRCSITGEKTLPVLEAAHIKAYAESGPHAVANGLLLRSDMHKLFDSGYITITKDYKVEVSKRIKEEFENGREYYQYHGKALVYLPDKDNNRPGENYIEWHNETFKG